MSPNYPVGFEADFVAQRSRLTTFFRYLLAIPLAIVGLVWLLIAYLAAYVAWFALLLTGRYPQGLYDAACGGVRYMARMNAYTQLLTDVYPPLDWGEHPEYPVRVPIAPPKEKYSRAKVLFRFFLGIPVMLIGYALSILGGVCALLSWFVIVFTGKQAEGLQNAIVMAHAYQARAAAYFLYITEDWPPFSPDAPAPAAPVAA